MKYLKIFFLLALTLLGGNAMAQIDLNNFDGIKSQGPIPQDLRLTLDELFSQDKQRARDYNDGKLKNRDKVLESSYYINKLTASGRVLYGDPISQMLNRIADTLMKDYPELRKNIHIYVIKSPEVNAFITGQGMLFVTTGMIAQVENEAQLAFVISHETIHFYKSHNWENLSTQYKKGSGNQEDKARQEFANFVKYHNRSREMENEADSLGIEMFYRNSPYDKRVSDGFFDVLQYGYLPFDEIAIDTNYFDTKYYHFSTNLFLDSVAAITARDDYDDSKSTHPNLLKRRERCSELLSDMNGGAAFVVTTRQEFEQLRDLARMECIRQNIIYADYVRALYDIMVMQRYMPDNNYLRKAQAQAYYGLSKFKNNTGSNEVVGDYKNVEGEAQQAYYFFRKVKKEELNMLAVRQLWQAHQIFPNDQLVYRMAEDATKELVTKNSFGRSSFSDKLDTVSTPTDTTTSRSKYDRIKQKKQKQAVVDMKRYFFTDIMEQDPAFKPFMDNCFLHASDTASNAKSAEKSSHKNMFVYASEYYVLSKEDVKFQESDRMEGKLTQYLENVAKQNDKGLVDFSDQALRGFSTDQQYNDFVSLNEWVNEFWQSKGDFSRQLSLQHEMNDLVQRYDADRINLTLVANLEGLFPEGSKGAYLFLPITWPVFFAGLASGYENTYLQSVYVDASTGELLSGTRYKYGIADSKAVVEGSIYDNMLRAEGKKDATFKNRHLMLGVDLILGINQGKGNTEAFGFSSEAGRKALFQFRPRVNLEYMINAHYAIHASASQSKTTFMEVATVKDNYENYYWDEVKDIRLNHDIYSFSLGLRKYKDMAPLGLYHGYSLQWHTTKINFDDNPNPGVSAADKRLNKFGFNFEFGRNYILFDRVVFNIGMNVGLVASVPFDFRDFSEKKHDNHWTDGFFFGQKLWVQNVFTLNVGLGILPF